MRLSRKIIGQPKLSSRYQRFLLNQSSDHECDESSEETRLFIQGQHLYFSSELTSKSCFDLKRELILLTNQQLVNEIQKLNPRNKDNYSPIYLHLNSPGGIVSGAFDLVDQIKASPIPIHSVVTGEVASAATLISCACTYRYMRPNAIMMIHQIRGGFEGKYQDLSDEYQNYTLAHNKLVDLYEKHTSMSRKTILKHLKDERELSAQECVKLGLVDQIL